MSTTAGDGDGALLRMERVTAGYARDIDILQEVSLTLVEGQTVGVIGLNGAVATTAAAGIAMIRAGSNDLSGLPLAARDVDGMAAYRDLYFGGWDLSHDDLATAAMRHGVIGEKELANGASSLSAMRPWPAVGSTDFCANIDGAVMNWVKAPSTGGVA